MLSRASVEPKEVAIRRRRMASAAAKMMTNAAVDIDQEYQLGSVKHRLHNDLCKNRGIGPGDEGFSWVPKR